MTNPSEITTEQRTLAAQLNERVKTLETQGTIATFAQARDLREIRDQELYKAIEKADGGFYSNFGDYVNAVTTKSPSTISQNISVITTFSQYADEQLAAAGPEKLDIARKMLGEGYYKTPDEALEAATKRSRSELIDIRKSSIGASGNITVALSTRKVVKAQATRFEEGFNKFSAIYSQVHNDPNNTPTDSQVMDFYLDVVNGLPNDFLMEAASGEGGAAPEMSGGFTPKDVPVADVVYFIAEQLADSGRDPNEILDQLREGVQSVQDRFEVQKREREEQEKARLKAEKEQAKEQDKEQKARERELEKKAKILRTVTPGYVVVLADGAEGEVISVGEPVDGIVQSIMLKSVKDGTHTILDTEGAVYDITELVELGIVGINKPKKEAAPKPEKAAKKTTDDETPAIGISKAQSAGRKPRASKKAAAAESEE